MKKAIIGAALDWEAATGERERERSKEHMKKMGEMKTLFEFGISNKYTNSLVTKIITVKVFSNF